MAYLENGENTLLVIDLLEVHAPPIPIPFLIISAFRFAVWCVSSGGVAVGEGVDVGIELLDRVGDEVVQQRVPSEVSAVAVAAIVVVGGSGVEAAA